MRDEVFLDGLSALGLTPGYCYRNGEPCLCFPDGLRSFGSWVSDTHAAGYVVCSRTKQNRRTGLSAMERAGAVVAFTETIVFQLVESEGSDTFKAIAPLSK
jgi:hypothetical protein